jgi:hypothetical protein
MSASASTPELKPARLDANVANELNALWRSIFERAHAGEPRGEEHGRPAASKPTTHAGDDAREFVRERPEQPSAKQTSTMPETLPLNAPTAVATAAPVAQVPIVSAVAIETVRSIATPEPQTPIAGLAAARAVPADVELAPAAVERARPNDDATPPAAEQMRADETVSVFMQGGAVTINVRDAVLGEDEALRCAFETARTLTGERAALRTLLLNGRTVYRQAPRPAATESPTLIFAC